MDGDIRNTDNVHNDDDGAHNHDSVDHKDYSVHDVVDSNHDKEKDLESFTHLLFFSPFTL
jgi:hypothetical protein